MQSIKATLNRWAKVPFEYTFLCEFAVLVAVGLIIVVIRAITGHLVTNNDGEPTLLGTILVGCGLLLAAITTFHAGISAARRHLRDQERQSEG